MDEQFSAACLSNNLELVKEMPDQFVPRWIFLNVCKLGYLDMAKLLYMRRPEILDIINYSLRCAGWAGSLNVIQWLHSVGVDISHPNVYIYTCLNGQLHILQWLHSLGINISGQKAINNACHSKSIETVKWLIENPYKTSSFIQFESYAKFKLEIKNLLIDHNLVHPRQLTGCDLLYYLARTNNLVPSDFDYPGTTKRGKHTKSALRNV